MEQINKESLSLGTFITSHFHKIMDKIIVWDLKAVSGQAMYRKHHRYAHLEIKMYKSEDNNNCVIYNFPTENIHPQIDYKKGIKESLNFFLKLISVLKGPDIFLTFEINDASYNNETGGSQDYEWATLYTLYNCFDNDFPKYDKEYVERVKKDNLKSASNE